MARRSILAASMATVLALVALRSVSVAFLPARQPMLRAGAATAAGLASSAAAIAPAFAEEAAAEAAKEAAPKIELGGGFAINLDIPETGLVNIVVLVAGLIYLLGPILSESMASREKEIETDISDAIAKYNEATERLAEAKKAQSQAEQVIAEIKSSVEKDKIEFKEMKEAETKKLVESQANSGKDYAKNLEVQANERVASFITGEAVRRGLQELKKIDATKATKFTANALNSL
eukprot:TRINITY_DN5683_c0_g1_i1.p1 TRINITY_DN5683_c0_g1~~TRINITY_DN5683_c0_g1_i1.p1  ORF type:complete len:260 (+),score=88.95 TRINITY_DN5683_c0_g1_i1:79-780(+)